MNGASPMQFHQGTYAGKTKKMEQQWRRLNGQLISVPLEQEIEKTITCEKQSGHVLKVCIGTDSQVKGRMNQFATVIVFVRKLNGGFMYIRKCTTTKSMTVKERMLTEVFQSVETAYKLQRVFEKHHVPLEVHADINSSAAFKSNVALKEASGYIQGMAGYLTGPSQSFAFRIKPHAFASSCCANKMVQ